MRRVVGLITLTVLAYFGDTTRLFGQNRVALEPDSQTQEAKAEKLLVDAYLTGMNLAPQDRAFLLATLGSSAAKRQPSLCRLWSEELFKIAVKLPMSWNRIAFEKNAAVQLSAVDPVRAFELFGQIDTPAPLGSGDLPEDLRANAANTVFFHYWNSKGPASLEQIRSQAEHIGDTGQYPYVAMAPILIDFAKRNDDSHLEVLTLFGEALTYYGRGSNFTSENRDFIAFLEEVWNVIPRNLQQQGLQLAVKHLLEKLKSPEGEVYSAQLKSKGGMAQFQSEAEEELYELLPRIREINLKWAQELIEQNPVLAQAEGGTDKASSSGSAVIRFNPLEAQKGQLEGFRNQASQMAQFNAALTAVSSDPDEALRMAESLDLGFKLRVHAQVAATLGAEHGDRANKLMQQTETSLDSVMNEPEKFQVLVVLASAATALHQDKTFDDIFARGFRLGEELFEEDMQAHPGRLVYQTASFKGLSRLIELGIRNDAELTTGRIEKVENDALRAHLLAIAADILYDRPPSPHPHP
jgi:hypothetical protein